MEGKWQRVASVATLLLVVCTVIGPALTDNGGSVDAAACSPFLLLNCIGTRGAVDAKCCNAVKQVLQPGCFCSEYRKGVVDSSSIIPLAKRCKVNLHIGGKC
ncbi:hypothetical protein KP509_13G039600 [Ceratopteris richardii]|uniref:Bifunctional inhibitor/plant lipid transfer protein/seed storage helical domain-containing protein n=1 Tax=Ceratopteris richardii TaxID=49495 RepID=A0A8T2TKC6_CERRI|nr:hypothetical protein KP509_13G039600 [Ceratopteris richardii]